MKILITGASGLIGREVGKKLCANGHDIIAVSRDPAETRKRLGFKAKLISWNELSDCPNVDVVVHLAGEGVADKRWSRSQKQKIRDSRVDTTKALVRTLRDKGIKAFIGGSAIGYYGDTGDEWATASGTAGSDFLANVCNQWESAIDEIKSSSTRVVKIRTGVVLARGGGALVKMIQPFLVGLGGPLGDGKHWMSWIHLEDISNLFVRAVEDATLSGVVNGVSPNPVQNIEFSKALAKALGKNLFLPVPKVAIKLALGEMAQVVLASQKVRQELSDFKFLFPRIEEALTDLCEPFRNGEDELVSEQWLPKTPEQIFPFFSNEKNLEDLTPKFLGFKVLGKSTPTIREGTLIDYRLKVHHIPLRWRTRIEAWSPNQSFVDTQLRGPYKKWHHTHEFLPLSGGTLMRDRVRYVLPFGIVGKIFAGWKVTRDVNEIFRFRQQVIDRLFYS